MDKATNAAAVGVNVTAPAWATLLSQVNVALTTVSLVLSLAFLAWRWHRAASGRGGE